MTTDLIPSLIKDAEELPEGPEKQKALADLLALQKENEIFEERRAALSAMGKSQLARRRIAAIFISLPIACLLLYFAASSILTGESPITFSRQAEKLSWHNDPYLFSSVIGFVALTGLIMLYRALYSIITGKDASGQTINQPQRPRSGSSR